MACAPVLTVAMDDVCARIAKRREAKGQAPLSDEEFAQGFEGFFALIREKHPAAWPGVFAAACRQDRLSKPEVA